MTESLFLSYYDEAGDDGFPNYSSPLFALSSCYIDFKYWKECFVSHLEFRQQLKNNYGLPVKIELHTKEFLLNKKPYCQLGLTENIRLEIISRYCTWLSISQLKFINVVINKKAIHNRKYNILGTSLTYSIQRIENSLSRINQSNRFIIITDEGRVGKMTFVARKMQKINFIPSKFHDGSYRKEINSLIEDPLPKKSSQSYFIQLADLMATIVYNYKLIELNISPFTHRMPAEITMGKLSEWLKVLKPCLNLQASTSPFGIVSYPK